MNKLTKTQFARPIVAEIIPFRRRVRRALVCVWRTDLETGRLACSWTKPTDDDQCRARDLGEPPPALPIAA